MKHIIIGGSGFTGGYLVKELVRQGEQVLVADCQPFPFLPLDSKITFQETDITRKESVAALDIKSDDIVYHLAARQYHDAIPAKNRLEWFCAVNVEGTKNILDRMVVANCRSLIYLSTDMVYGLPQHIPVPVSHNQAPLGEYGESKKRSEALCHVARKRGMNITILRPRLIIGPGRLGILSKLFKLIDANLPVPMIGNGSNAYQMVSVFDVVQAIMKARQKGIPNKEYNLGSDNPPSVRELLQKLIKKIGSKSILIPTPGGLVKKVLGILDVLGFPIMYREQYSIADVTYLVDISATKTELEWSPAYTDEDMIQQAFDRFKKSA